MAEAPQIGDVPPELHALIAERARAQGLTISQYLLRGIARIEGKPEIGRVLDAHGGAYGWPQAPRTCRPDP